MKCALVVSNYNDAARSLNVIEQGKATGLFDYLILVENGSTDDSCEFLKSQVTDDIILLGTKKNRGFSCGHNIGMKYACKTLRADYVFIIASDISFTSKCIEECIRQHKLHKNIGIIAPRIKGPDGHEQVGAWRFPTYKEFVLHCYPGLRNLKSAKRKIYNLDSCAEDYCLVDAVRGSFMSFKSEALEKAGYFDENVYLYNEENIIAKRMNSVGYSVAIMTHIFYTHNHVNSSTQNDRSYSNLLNNSASDLYYMKYYNNVGSVGLFILKVSEWIRAFHYHMSGVIKKAIHR